MFVCGDAKLSLFQATINRFGYAVLLFLGEK
jgi:hypothetical protein